MISAFELHSLGYLCNVNTIKLHEVIHSIRLKYTLFYKQDFYKQHQAENGKKLSKS